MSKQRDFRPKPRDSAQAHATEPEYQTLSEELGRPATAEDVAKAPYPGGFHDVLPGDTVTDVGNSYSITFERHATKPKLWRLRERSIIDGVLFENHTDWLEFTAFTPKLGMAQGRMRAFLFPQFGARVPMQVRAGER